MVDAEILIDRWMWIVVMGNLPNGKLRQSMKRRKCRILAAFLLQSDENYANSVHSQQHAKLKQKFSTWEGVQDYESVDEHDN